MLPKMATLLRLAHEWLPLGVGKMRLTVEWHHTPRERPPHTVDSEHNTLARGRLPPGLIRIPLPRPELELAVLQPGIG